MDRMPKDPVMLLSYVNTQLRDFYPSLDEFCGAVGADRASVESALEAIGYVYDRQENRFR